MPTLPGTRRLPIVSVAEARGDGDARGGRVFDQLARFEVLVERLERRAKSLAVDR